MALANFPGLLIGASLKHEYIRSSFQGLDGISPVY